MPERKQPQRRCTGCQEMKDKKSLVRIVHCDDVFSLDFTGKKNGRGAYICKNPDCLNKAVKSRGLERSFKQRIPTEVYDALRTAFDLDLGGDRSG